MPASWNDLKVLVTGAKGFLGSHVAARVASVGAITYGFARKLQPSDDRTRWFCGDLSDPATVQAVLKEIRPDVVFHLAGQTTVALDRQSVLTTFHNNLACTVSLLSGLVETGCQRVVITGSLEEPLPEEADTAPPSAYGVSKWAETVYARMFHARYKLPVVVVRPYMTYGPRQRPTKLIPSVTLSLLRGLSPTINCPDREVDWIYVEDVAAAILAAGLVPGVEGRTIELGSGVLVPVREVAKQLESLVGGVVTVRLSTSGEGAGVDGRRAHTEPARRLLGWQPSTSLTTGLAHTVAWYRARLNDYGAIR